MQILRFIGEKQFEKIISIDQLNVLLDPTIFDETTIEQNRKLMFDFCEQVDQYHQIKEINRVKLDDILSKRDSKHMIVSSADK